MEININTDSIQAFLNLPPDQMMWSFFINFGWMILAAIFIYGTILVYHYRLKGIWAEKNLKFILLAIDIPKTNEQSPKAVENMFTYLGGAHGSINFFEKWFEGKSQQSFSYEVVSLEGYTQFLIRTPVEFRNLIETSVYSQYPDAEISEVEDYVGTVPHRYPDEEYDVWGAEFIQARPWQYPIKVYREFEHQYGPSETQFKDPMASLMDLCSSLHEGEQLWTQILVAPIGFDWVEDVDNEVNKILGKKAKSKEGLFMKLVSWIGEASEVIYSIWGDIEEKKKDDDKGLSMIELNPKQKRKIEGIHEKASKLAFEAKIRVVYVARKDIMARSKVVNGIIGYMKQFAALDLNNLMPDVKRTMTKAVYFRQKRRLLRKKNRIINNYVNRDDVGGRKPGIYSIEELATLWHFPIDANVKAPLVQKAPGRKADAPFALPLASDISSSSADLFQSEVFSSQSEEGAAKKEENVKPEPTPVASASSNEEAGKDVPENLPFV